MQPIAFTNEKTAAAYEALTPYDQQLEIPPHGKDCHCKTYTGWLSNITPCAAARYVASGGNLLRKKANETEASPVPVGKRTTKK